MLSMILAVSLNDVIGKENGLPWHIPSDLKRFKEITTGKTIIMGRKTFESLPKILPNRTHIVLTRDKDYKADNENVIVLNDYSELINVGVLGKGIEYIVIGGAEIFKMFEDYVDKIYLTVVLERVEGDKKYRLDYLLEDKWEVREDLLLSAEEGEPKYMYQEYYKVV